METEIFKVCGKTVLVELSSEVEDNLSEMLV
jgi:hypothetical protein